MEINDSGSSINPTTTEPGNVDHPDNQTSIIANVKPKRENCDKGTTLALGAKMSKIATLIPNKGTIKGTFKNAKRKHLFPKKQNKETPNVAE